jgi:hypothetical protein
LNANTLSHPEIVALFEDRAGFDAAVEKLLASGFRRWDISVLAGHESLEVTEPDSEGEAVLTAGLGEMKYVTPAVAAGFIALAGGPIVAPVAALVAGAVGALALTDYISALTAHQDPEEAARAIEFGGLLLWVRADTAETEDRARKLLTECGGRNIHKVEREPA